MTFQNIINFSFQITISNYHLVHSLNNSRVSFSLFHCLYTCVCILVHTCFHTHLDTYLDTCAFSCIFACILQYLTLIIETKSISGKMYRNSGMVHFPEINKAPSPYSMLQHIGRVETPKLVPRNCLRYLQTTLGM